MLTAAALSAHAAKPVPPISEVSTDLIILLGGVILLIILVPLLLHSREWLGKKDENGNGEQKN